MRTSSGIMILNCAKSSNRPQEAGPIPRNSLKTFENLYIAGSVKDNERKRRKFKIPIVLTDIANDTRLP